MALDGCGPPRQGGDYFNESARQPTQKVDEVDAAGEAAVPSVPDSWPPVEPAAREMQRFNFALELSMAGLASGSGNYWVILPPAGTVLGIFHLPYCDENTLRALHRNVDFGKLRALGFERVVCYPEVKYSARFDSQGFVQFAGLGEGDGWHCVIVGEYPQSGMCFRSVGLCRHLAQNRGSARPDCVDFATAYCSVGRDGEFCYTSAEACVESAAPGASPCVAKT
ncbi:MAG: hypothetical protein R3B06_14030 [Kofleriaceae bacterium]